MQQATLASKQPDTERISAEEPLKRGELMASMQSMIAQLGSAFSSASQVGSKTRGLRLSDVKLSEFSGNDDPEASYIHPEYFISLLGWIRECKTILSFSGLSAKEQVVVVVNALRGAARKA